jgi:hypothetical protein
MSGEELYALFSDACLSLQGCAVDCWDDLMDEDQEVWCDMAARIEEKQNANR